MPAKSAQTENRRSYVGGIRTGMWAAMLGASSPLFAVLRWENAVNVLQNAFTSTIARGLSLVAIVVGGLMFAFGESESKRMLAGILFGVGVAFGAMNFKSWLFPG